MPSTKEVKDTTHDLAGRILSHVLKSGIPRDFIVDMTDAARLPHDPNVLLATLGLKHLWGNDRFPFDPASQKAMRQLQEIWGTGVESVPAVMFVAAGTKEFRVEMAMVRREYFQKTSEQLLTDIATAQEHMQDDDHMVRSLEFVYTAVSGKRPDGSDRLPPLAELPPPF